MIENTCSLYVYLEVMTLCASGRLNAQVASSATTTACLNCGPRMPFELRNRRIGRLQVRNSLGKSPIRARHRCGVAEVAVGIELPRPEDDATNRHERRGTRGIRQLANVCFKRERNVLGTKRRHVDGGQLSAVDERLHLAVPLGKQF